MRNYYFLFWWVWVTAAVQSEIDFVKTYHMNNSINNRSLLYCMCLTQVY